MPAACPSARRFQPCLLKVVRLLERLIRVQDIPPDYIYYGVASPWLQARLDAPTSLALPESDNRSLPHRWVTGTC